MIKGQIRFDGITMGEGQINFLTPSVQLKVKAAFVDTASGKTHGWTETSTGWSKETLLKLEELKAAIESDLVSVHFSGTDGSAVQNAQRRNFSDAPQGLGEHLESVDAPQL